MCYLNENKLTSGSRRQRRFSTKVYVVNRDVKETGVASTVSVNLFEKAFEDDKDVVQRNGLFNFVLIGIEIGTDWEDRE
jgi:hypothetical protein